MVFNIRLASYGEENVINIRRINYGLLYKRIKLWFDAHFLNFLALNTVSAKDKSLIVSLTREIMFSVSDSGALYKRILFYLNILSCNSPNTSIFESTGDMCPDSSFSTL